MKFFKSAFCAFCFLACFGSVKSVFASASIIATLNAKIAVPISVTQTSGLNFGSFAVGASAGTVTVSQAGNSAVGVTLVSGGQARSPGIFAVTGEALGTGTIPYTFTKPANVSLTGPSGSTAMSATLSFNSGSSARSLSSAGSETVTINSTLSVGANQRAGYYSGIYTVTVAY